MGRLPTLRVGTNLISVGWFCCVLGACGIVDATVTLLMAALDTGKARMAASDIEQALAQMHGTQAFQGASGQIALGADGDPINKAVVILHVSSDGLILMENAIGGSFLK